jgi:hypothetical protein
MLHDAVDAGTVHLDVIADELRPELARASQQGTSDVDTIIFGRRHQ